MNEWIKELPASGQGTQFFKSIAEMQRNCFEYAKCQNNASQDEFLGIAFDS